MTLKEKQEEHQKKTGKVSGDYFIQKGIINLVGVQEEHLKEARGIYVMRGDVNNIVALVYHDPRINEPVLDAKFKYNLRAPTVELCLNILLDFDNYFNKMETGKAYILPEI